MIEVYTAEMARNDVAATEQLRREQEKKKWDEAVAAAIERNLKNIYTEIKKCACKGIQSYDYDLYGVDCDEFYISPTTLCHPVMEHLFNAGYSVDYEGVQSEGERYYEFYISW